LAVEAAITDVHEVQGGSVLTLRYSGGLNFGHAIFVAVPATRCDRPGDKQW
jgi:hypothetical protein